MNKASDIGVVLKTTRYGDHSVVAHLFCRASGQSTFFVRSFYSKKSAFRPLLQPLYILEVESLEGNAGMHSLQTAAIARPLPDVASDPIKISIAFYCAELLHKTIPESYVNTDWFDFVVNALEVLEHEVAPANYALWFTARMCSWYGVLPSALQLQEQLRLLYPHWSVERMAPFVNAVVNGDYAELRVVTMAREERNAALRTFVQFLQMHAGTTLKLQSIEVLAELFG